MAHQIELCSEFFLVQCGCPRWGPLIYLTVSRVFTHALRLPRFRHHTALFSDLPTVQSVGLTVGKSPVDEYIHGYLNRPCTVGESFTERLIPNRASYRYTDSSM